MKFAQFLIIAPLCGLFFCSPAQAQKTKAQINTEITTTFPDNTVGAITPAGLRSVTGDLANSIMPTAPVVSGNVVCFDGTSGLLKDCGSSPSTSPVTVGITPIGSGTTLRVLYDNGGILGEYSNVQLTAFVNLATSSVSGALPAWPNNTTTFFRGDGTYATLNASALNGLGSGVATVLGINQNVSGGIVSPSPTRAGDIIYWNGTSWVTLAGNNSGTQLLQENASGLPSWVTVSGTGTVTSVTCFGTAITSSGTCTTAATKSDQQAGTSATAVVTPLHQQDHDSASKAWVNFVGASGNINNTAFNVPGTAVTRNSTGNYTISFTTNFANTGYICDPKPIGTQGFGYQTTTLVAAVTVQIVNVSGTAIDPINVGVVCFGRQ